MDSRQDRGQRRGVGKTMGDAATEIVMEGNPTFEEVVAE
jgi:hypothetical protein